MSVGLDKPHMNTRTKMNIFFKCLVVASIASLQFACGLQLSMVASRSPFSQQTTRSLGTTINKNSIQKGSQSSMTSTFISQLACMALKRRLEDHTHVSCELTADSNQLILGRVGPVTVKGRGWESPLGLTCKAIEATVNECKLDMGRVISNQKLVLTTPAEGRAMVALSATDFGNFITHPLMKPPSPPVSSNDNNKRLMFIKENVSMNPSSGSVQFYGIYAGSKWKFTLQRVPEGSQKAKISASLAEKREDGDTTNVNVDRMAKALAFSTSQFFNEMVFELDGTFLSFEDMMLTDKGKESSVMLSLRIKVKKFPSPGLEF